MLIGLHVSMAGGIFNAPDNAAKLNCETFQIFTRSPRGGKAAEITDEIEAQFKDNCKQHGFTSCYVHTPYYINYASAQKRIQKAAIEVVRDELERSSKLGVTALMTHLGSGKDVDEKTAREMVVQGILEMLDGYQGSTKFTMEIAAGAGLILGASFEEIGYYITQIEKKDKRLKDSIGVTVDTCHAFAVGYDLSTETGVKKTLKDFDEHIGLHRLTLIHANDSKHECGSRKDRHEHIGKGHIGASGFKALVQHPKLKKVDVILETPHDGVEQDDLKLLKKFRDK